MIWFIKRFIAFKSFQSKIALPYFFVPSLLLSLNFFRSDNIELANLTDLDEKSSRVNLK